MKETRATSMLGCSFCREVSSDCRNVLLAVERRRTESARSVSHQLEPASTQSWKCVVCSLCACSGSLAAGSHQRSETGQMLRRRRQSQLRSE